VTTWSRLSRYESLGPILTAAFLIAGCADEPEATHSTASALTLAARSNLYGIDLEATLVDSALQWLKTRTDIAQARHLQLTDVGGSPWGLIGDDLTPRRSQLVRQLEQRGRVRDQQRHDDQLGRLLRLDAIHMRDDLLS
jgi:hypothetical protein